MSRRLQFISPQQLRQDWDNYVPFIQAGLDRAADGARVEDVYAECQAGQAALYQALDDDRELCGVAVFKLSERYGQKAFHMWVGVHLNKDRVLAREYLAHIVDLAKHAGADVITTTSPRPVDKALPGFAEVHRTFALDISETAA